MWCPPRLNASHWLKWAVRAELKHGKQLREGIDGQPKPEDLVGAPQPGAQLIQLEVGDLQGVEVVLVQRLCVFASTR
jgi:hypothetical protein